MRKALCFVFFIVGSTIYSQIKIYDTGEVIGKCSYSEGGLMIELRKKDNIITFTYRDLRFKDVQSFRSFVFRESDLDNIYGLFLDFEGKKDCDSKTLELENGELLIFRYWSFLGRMHVDVFHQAYGIITEIPGITRHQTRKLFGKK